MKSNFFSSFQPRKEAGTNTNILQQDKIVQQHREPAKVIYLYQKTNLQKKPGKVISISR